VIMDAEAPDSLRRLHMYRQPYRITMAQWDYSVFQKRILSGIVFSLQKEIALIESGIAPEDLPLFQQSKSWVEVSLPLKLFVPTGTNYHMVRKALDAFDSSSTILLPEVKGRRGPSLPESTLSLHVLKHQAKPKCRTLRLRMEKSLTYELVRSSSGLTTLCWETMTALRSPHAIRLYEIASHWKDQERLSMPIPQFRRWMQLCDSYKMNKELMRRVIRPAEQQLQKISDVYVNCEPVRHGRSIEMINLYIHQKRNRQDEDLLYMRLREQITKILRMHFRFREEHFRQIEGVMRNGNRLKALNEKIGMLWSHLDKSKGEVNDVTLWALASIRNAFPD
jgi:hypothetical protein